MMCSDRGAKRATVALGPESVMVDKGVVGSASNVSFKGFGGFQLEQSQHTICWVFPVNLEYSGLR